MMPQRLPMIFFLVTILVGAMRPGAGGGFWARSA